MSAENGNGSSVRGDLPDFVLNPPNVSGYISGTGFSQNENIERAKEKALLDAVADLEQQLYISNVSVEYEVPIDEYDNTDGYSFEDDSDWNDLGNSRIRYSIAVDWENRTLEFVVNSTLPEAGHITTLILKDNQGTLINVYERQIEWEENMRIEEHDDLINAGMLSGE